MRNHSIYLPDLRPDAADRGDTTALRQIVELIYKWGKREERLPAIKTNTFA